MRSQTVTIGVDADGNPVRPLPSSRENTAVAAAAAIGIWASPPAPSSSPPHSHAPSCTETDCSAEHTNGNSTPHRDNAPMKNPSRSVLADKFGVVDTEIESTERIPYRTRTTSIGDPFRLTNPMGRTVRRSDRILEPITVPVRPP